MELSEFYLQLFASLEADLGTRSARTLVPIVGFTVGGPLPFCTFGDRDTDFVHYVSCELAVNLSQKPCSVGRYELLCTADDREWVRSVVSDVGRMSLDVCLDEGHVIDIAPWVGNSVFLQGIVLECATRVQIDGVSFGVLRVIGVTRDELEHAQQFGVAALLERFKQQGSYPRTTARRPSVI
jgi:Suppressor of fused protein (SUFU)